MLIIGVGRFANQYSSSAHNICALNITHLTFDLDLCRAKKNIQWSMAVELLVAVGRNN